MLNTTSETALAAHCDTPKAEIAAFLENEEEPLTELLEALGEFEAADAVRRAARLAAEQTPDLGALGRELVQVIDALAGMPFAVVEDMMFAGLGPRDAHAAIRWSGARLTDLLGRLGLV
jgi:hypothetical protein